MHGEQIANTQFTPASRQPYILLSSRPTLLVSVQASAGSSTNTFLRAALWRCPPTHVYQHQNHKQSTQLAVPHRWEAPELLHRSASFVRLQAEELLWKKPIRCQPIACRTRPRRSVHNLPDTMFTDDRHFLASCRFDKGVVEQLATRVVDVIQPHPSNGKKCLGFLTHWPVSSLVHTCKVGHAAARGTNQLDRQDYLLCVTILQVNRSRNPPFQNCWGRPQPCVSEWYVCRTQNALLQVSNFSLCSLCSSLFQTFRVSFCRSLARTNASWLLVCIFCATFRFRVQAFWICESDTFALARASCTTGVLRPGVQISACLTRVALTRVAVDSSVVTASSSRSLHSVVCPCPDIGNPARWTSKAGRPAVQPNFSRSALRT